MRTGTRGGGQTRPITWLPLSLLWVHVVARTTGVSVNYGRLCTTVACVGGSNLKSTLRNHSVAACARWRKYGTLCIQHTPLCKHCFGVQMNVHRVLLPYRMRLHASVSSSHVAYRSACCVLKYAFLLHKMGVEGRATDGVRCAARPGGQSSIRRELRSSTLAEDAASVLRRCKDTSLLAQVRPL